MPNTNNEEKFYTVADIARDAIQSVDGVGGLVPAPIPYGIKFKEPIKGICLSRLDQLEFNIFIQVLYGSKIPGICFAVQEAVKKAVEEAMGLEVYKVHLHIQGIQ